MKKYAIKWLAVLSVLALLTGLSGALPVVAAKEEEPAVSGKMMIDEILERDGLLDGIWFPWFDGGSIGHGLTGNDVMAKYYGASWAKVSMDAYGAHKVYREIYNLKAMGYNMLGYGGSVYDEGVVFDPYGDVLGVKQDYLDNARRLLQMCRDIGMPVMWTICFHSSSSPNYHGMDAYNSFSQKYARAEVADHYAERFVRPVCEMLAEYPDVVGLVAIADEPENEINDSDIGNHFGGDRSMYGVNQENMVYFMSRINDVVKEVLPNVARTVASNNTNKAIYGGFELDLMGHNRYNNSAHLLSVEEFVTDVPVIMTEYNVGGELEVSANAYTELLIDFREEMVEKGYKGGISWCWLSHGVNSKVAYYLLDSAPGGNKPNTDFISTVADMRHYIDDYRAAHRGETVVLDKPVMYCNEGGGYVEWIPSRQATSMDLLRSTDGGKTWVKLLDNVNPKFYINKGKGKYFDEAISGSMYKVVVRDDAGNEVESEPTNIAGEERQYVRSATQILPEGELGIGNYNSQMCAYPLTSFGEVTNRPVSAEVNLLIDGSFEEGVGAWTSMLGDTVRVVEDATAPDGDKSLYFDSSTTTSAKWHKFTVPVEPNTEYIFSVWVKGAYLSAQNSGQASIGVIDPTINRFMVYNEFRNRTSRDNRQIYPPSWDGEWHLRSVRFNSLGLSKVTIALYGASTQMWVDDMALFKNGDGIKYVSENAGNGISYYMTDAFYCEPQDSLTANPQVSVEGSDYWQTGYGWANGFMSVYESDWEYGNSLHYTSDGSMPGVYYIKWVDVTPYTDYIFSVSIKVLQSGAGKLVLLDDKKAIPVPFVEVDFDIDSFGEEWFPFNIGLNTGAYDRIGIAVCDLGGEALLDNIRLFESGKAAEGEDPYHGWRTDWDGERIYYDHGVQAISKWICPDGVWYYMDADGYVARNKWVKDSKGWCYLTGDGAMATNKWIKDSQGWCYVGGDGYCITNKWVKDSVGWCYLDADGRMATNKWVKDSKGWCYVGKNGYIVKNSWVKDGGKWYFLDQNGYMATNAWKKDSKGWCFVGSDGAMKTNAWVKDSKGWCYVGSDGYAVTECWKKDSIGWIYLDKNGSMTKNAWVKDNGKWYYLDGEGYMIANTSLKLGSKTYHFNASGVCTNP